MRKPGLIVAGVAVAGVPLSTVDAHIEVRVDAETGEVRADDAVDDDSGGVDDHGQPGSDNDPTGHA